VCVERQYSSSRYNFAIPVKAGFLLYNSASGKVFEILGRDGGQLIRELAGHPQLVSTHDLDPRLITQLREGGFLVDPSEDEVAPIRKRFFNAIAGTPVVLTLTTTMDCNLGCYYCYEERSPDKLKVTHVEQVVQLARNLLTTSGRDSLHVDWYGGEPLMNLEFLEHASGSLQALCQELWISYSASVISNGTCWPSDIAGFVRRNRIRQVQISFDGLKANHDKRRKYRKEHASQSHASSFDVAVRLVDELVRYVRVDLRFNVDRGNQVDVIPFLQFARERGWFAESNQAVFQPARLSSYSDRSAFMRKLELSLEEYEQIRSRVRREAATIVVVEEAEVPDKFPYPRSSVCAALAADSVVVGADAKLYRCGLQVGETRRSVGTLELLASPLLPILGQTVDRDGSEERWWKSFDPTTLPTCSRCSFLPVCWGGCPKKHLEGDGHALWEQGEYWRRNLARLVVEGVGKTCDPSFAFSESDQFREIEQGLSATQPT
jgi:uncharacterized protein